MNYRDFKAQFRIARPDHTLSLHLDFDNACFSLVDLAKTSAIDLRKEGTQVYLSLPDAVRLSTVAEVTGVLNSLLEDGHDTKHGYFGCLSSAEMTDEVNRILPAVVGRLKHFSAQGAVWNRWHDWLSSELEYIPEPYQDPEALTDDILANAIFLDAYVREGRQALFDIVRTQFVGLRSAMH